jgi:hypothetical protein
MAGIIGGSVVMSAMAATVTTAISTAAATSATSAATATFSPGGRRAEIKRHLAWQDHDGAGRNDRNPCDP